MLTLSACQPALHISVLRTMKALLDSNVRLAYSCWRSRDELACLYDFAEGHLVDLMNTRLDRPFSEAEALKVCSRSIV